MFHSMTSKEDFLNQYGLVEAIETQDAIYGFFGKYRCLSNFHLYPVTLDGLTYCCSEAAYMAQKTEDVDIRKQFAALTVASEAKKMGKTVLLRPNWDEVHRLHSMYRVLFAKFSQDLTSLNVLLSTGNKYLEETNWWGDTYWGKCHGKGYNHLGQVLMTIRGFVRGSQ